VSVPECVVCSNGCAGRGTMLSVEEFEAESSQAMGIPSDAAVEKVCSQRIHFVAPSALQLSTEQSTQRWRTCPRAASQDFALNSFSSRVKSCLPSPTRTPTPWPLPASMALPQATM
jgi:hypothetical protein